MDVTDPSPRRPRRRLALWISCFAVLALVGLFCQFFLRPYLKARAMIAIYSDAKNSASAREAVALAGGPESAVEVLGLYTRLPACLAHCYWKQQALVVLAHCGPDGCDPLIAALTHSDSELRASAAEALGILRDPRAFEPLVAALRDRNAAVRRNAVLALGTLGDSRAGDPLIAALKDEVESVRSYAAVSLGSLQDPNAIKPLLEVLRKDRGGARRGAALALARCVDGYGPVEEEEMVDELARALAVDDDVVQVHAAEALRLIGPKADSAVAALMVALTDSDNYVREGAAQALSEMGPMGQHAIPALRTRRGDRSKEVRKAAAEAVKKLQPPSRDELADHIKAILPKNMMLLRVRTGEVAPVYRPRAQGTEIWVQRRNLRLEETKGPEIAIHLMDTSYDDGGAGVETIKGQTHPSDFIGSNMKWRVYVHGGDAALHKKLLEALRLMPADRPWAEWVPPPERPPVPR